MEVLAEESDNDTGRDYNPLMDKQSTGHVVATYHNSDVVADTTHAPVTIPARSEKRKHEERRQKKTTTETRDAHPTGKSCSDRCKKKWTENISENRKKSI